jgi:hypothetical protein
MGFLPLRQITSLRLLSNIDARIAGAERAAVLATQAPATVAIDLGPSDLRRGCFALVAVDAIAAQFPHARFQVVATSDLRALLEEHIAERYRLAARDAKPALVVDCSPGRGGNASLDLSSAPPRLTVPATRPGVRVHGSDGFAMGCHAAGLAHVGDAPPRLRLSAQSRREARRWLARHVGIRGALVGRIEARGPRTTYPRLDRVMQELDDRIGIIAVQLDERARRGAMSLPATMPPSQRAAVATMCAVCVGDECGWAHIAAAAGAAVVTIHSDSDPITTAPAARDARGVWRECTVPDAHPARVHAGAPCADCLAAQEVVTVAEQLAAQRFPWDRLARVWS